MILCVSRDTFPTLFDYFDVCAISVVIRSTGTMDDVVAVVVREIRNTLRRRSQPNFETLRYPIQLFGVCAHVYFLCGTFSVVAPEQRTRQSIIRPRRGRPLSADDGRSYATVDGYAQYFPFARFAPFSFCRGRGQDTKRTIERTIDGFGQLVLT